MNTIESLEALYKGEYKVHKFIEGDKNIYALTFTGADFRGATFQEVIDKAVAALIEKSASPLDKNNNPIKGVDTIDKMIFNKPLDLQ